ncbi:MAG: VWA domain-containing protein [Acidimicrobiia bacterium]|nr:VWA domain-containing protein [Acidimicrobiia bacterium]
MIAGAWARRNDDDGVILILSALVLILFIGVAAFVVDITLQSQSRQSLWNSADASVLAGASQLPDDPDAAAALAEEFALKNDASLDGELVTTYRCLVADAGGGVPDATNIPGVCDPGPDIGPSDWVCEDGKCAAVCVPADGDTCNTIVMEVRKTIDYTFAPAIGFDQGETDVLSAACRGACGGPITGPLDLILIIDRTTSMSDTDLANAKAASRALLGFLDPGQQRVGLAGINAGDPTNSCVGKPPGDGGEWLLVGLSSNYQNADGSLNGGSSLVSTINCLAKQTGTDLGSPIKDEAYGQRDALSHLLAFRTPDVPQAIILLSDGAANNPGANPCQYAEDMAAAAKVRGVEMFTIGFGVAGKSCGDAVGDYTSSGQGVTQLLASMASGGAGDNCATGGENSDGDNFFCTPKSGDLSALFLAAASQLVSGASLVELPSSG